MKRLTGISMFLVLALALAACAKAAPTAAPTAAATEAPTTAPTTASSGATEAVASTPASSNIVEVSLKGFAFNPKEITVKVGTTITWTNNDGVNHNVISDTGVFSSDTLASGDTFQYTFDKAGTYQYSCSFHVPNMVGTVIVTP